MWNLENIKIEILLDIVENNWKLILLSKKMIINLNKLFILIFDLGFSYQHLDHSVYQVLFFVGILHVRFR